MKVKATLSALPKYVFHHLHDEKHSNAHRMTCGAVVMWVGVVVASLAGLVKIYLLHLVLDGAGYAIHGIGLTPFIDIAVKTFCDE